MNRATRSAVIILLATGFAACGGTDRSELEQRVEEIKQRPGGAIEPLPSFEPYEGFTYSDEDLRDPFIPVQAFAEAEEEEDEPHDSDIAPDPDRPREPLERYALDSLRMVGTLSRDNQLWGLVRAPDGTVHQVLEGNYLGQNHGEIHRIRNDAIELVEIVRTGDHWEERDAALGLGEEG